MLDRFSWGHPYPHAPIHPYTFSPDVAAVVTVVVGVVLATVPATGRGDTTSIFNIKNPQIITILSPPLAHARTDTHTQEEREGDSISQLSIYSLSISLSLYLSISLSLYHSISLSRTHIRTQKEKITKEHSNPNSSDNTSHLIPP